MSTEFYSFMEAIAFYAVWMLSVCSTIDLFRDTRDGRISRWARVLGAISIISTLAAFVFTVLVGENLVA